MVARHLKWWFTLGALVSLVVGCVPANGSVTARDSDCATEVSFPTPTDHFGIPYGPDAAHVLDLYPACTEEAVGTIMFVPGGGYTELLRGAVWPEVRRLRDDGWVVVSVDYRLAPLHRWSAQGADIRLAIHWWRTSGASQWNAPASPLVGLGWSAGGHLAEWATVREDGPTFDAGVSVAGATYWPERLGSDAAIALLGPFPSTSRQIDASTLPHLDADDPPLLHVHARNDSIVRVRQAELLAFQIQQSGDPSRHHVVIDESCGHSIHCLTPQRIDPFLDAVLASHQNGA